jgi:CIC family chloride channel protein
VLEVSGNYSIVLPVILANTIAYLLARSLQKTPVLELFTHQDGLELPSMEEKREERDLHLEDALDPVNLPTFQGGDTPAFILQGLSESKASTALIQCTGLTWYAARLDEIEAIARQAQTQQFPTVEALLSPERTPILFPDQPLDTALHHFSRWPILPITNRSRRGALEGLISLAGVLKRYQQD